MQQSELWHLEGNPWERYERYLMPDILRPWAADLVALAILQPGEWVLDVACGTGAVTRLIAQQVGTSGRVVGLDRTLHRLAVARALPPTPGAHVKWHAGDALALPFATAVLQCVCCQQGLQCIPDKPAAVRKMHRVLVPGGRVAINVWRLLSEHPASAALVEALGRYVSPEAARRAPSPVRLQRSRGLRALVVGADFRDMVIRPTVQVVRAPSAAAFTRRHVAGLPAVAPLVAQVDDQTREALLQDVSASLRPYVTAEGLALPKASPLVTAHT